MDAKIICVRAKPWRHRETDRGREKKRNERHLRPTDIGKEQRNRTKRNKNEENTSKKKK